MNRYQKWFALAVLLGIIANFSFSFPAVLAPSWLLTRLDLPQAYQTIWLRDAGLLLFFLTVLYFPAALNPLRYKVNSVVLVVGRLAFGLFWLWPYFFANAPRAYLTFGLIDLGLGLLQGVLLLLLLREEEKYL